MPERFLSMPRNRPGTWRNVPTVTRSVGAAGVRLPHVLLHRYGRSSAAAARSRFREGCCRLVVIRNWVAVIGTARGVSSPAPRAPAVLAAWIEHTLWAGSFEWPGASSPACRGWKLGEMLRFAGARGEPHAAIG
jgi:hypothetical protein